MKNVLRSLYAPIRMDRMFHWCVDPLGMYRPVFVDHVGRPVERKNTTKN